MTAYTYMLECADGSLYVGSTRSIDLRLYQHSIGEGSVYTRDRLPVRLIWLEEWSHIGEAFNREKQIQNWSRAKRLALVEERWDDLHELSRRRGKRPT